MIVFVCILIDVESQCKFPIALKTGTLVVALQALYRIALCEFGRATFNFLLDALTITSNEDLVLAWLVFFASERAMTLVLTGMRTALVFATSLLAGL